MTHAQSMRHVSKSMVKSTENIFTSHAERGEAEEAEAEDEDELAKGRSNQRRVFGGETSDGDAQHEQNAPTQLRTSMEMQLPVQCQRRWFTSWISQRREGVCEDRRVRVRVVYQACGQQKSEKAGARPLRGDRRWG